MVRLSLLAACAERSASFPQSEVAATDTAEGEQIRWNVKPESARGYSARNRQIMLRIAGEWRWASQIKFASFAARLEHPMRSAFGPLADIRPPEGPTCLAPPRFRSFASRYAARTGSRQTQCPECFAQHPNSTDLDESQSNLHGAARRSGFFSQGAWAYLALRSVHRG